MGSRKAAANTIVVYGIPNCDTVKKARVWLEEHGVEFEFHDFRKAGVSEPLVRDWLKDVPLESLVNRRGTTWRGLSDDMKAEADSEAGAIALMIHKPSVIKRPVVVVNGRVKALGFAEDQYTTLFA
ncbi:ArsC family reductase [Paraburkholderia rhizosphaerae]|uniref:Spx/MgsR family transcriptional regulator n=1 Tax=Paraburkholderia rhizosphaerae TaxID=480658 RepID=A0A4R8LI61_9BURK|nr:ArsC family reductase [Paraburkholderia rhizosphaerae]TDY42088.1 Spx/MgsR family transcriptional regulator [Paraburkholderia rhizosphaerae]